MGIAGFVQYRFLLAFRAEGLGRGVVAYPRRDYARNTSMQPLQTYSTLNDRNPKPQAPKPLSPKPLNSKPKILDPETLSPNSQTPKP